MLQLNFNFKRIEDMSANTHTLPQNRFSVNVASTDLVFRSLLVNKVCPTGRDVLKAGEIGIPEETVLLQWLASGDFEEIRPDEPIRIPDQGPPSLIYGRADRLYRLTLDQRFVLWPDETITEKQLRVIGRVPEERELFLERRDEEDLKIEPTVPLNLASMGGEVVYSVAPFWSLNVQGVVIQVEAAKISVHEAILKAGFDPDKNWIIVAKGSKGKAQIDADDVIDLSQCEIEKIRLTPREINNGDSQAGQTTVHGFSLLPTDEEGLERRGIVARCVIDNGRRWLIIDKYPLPNGLSPHSASLAFEIPSSYPRAEIDMFYCYPAVRRVDGRGIPQTQVTEVIEGKNFQRWSRHRGAKSRWDPTTDSVLTHLTLVDASLRAEGVPGQ